VGAVAQADFACIARRAAVQGLYDEHPQFSLGQRQACSEP